MAVIYLGCDPGVTGAIAMLTPAPDWRCEVLDLPVYETQGRLRKTKHVDAKRLQADLGALVPAGAEVVATIEDVFTIPGKGSSVHSTDSLVESRAIVEAAFRVLGFQVQRVRPQTWQRFYGLKGGDKSLSIGTAQRLYPNAGISLKKHHNKAEAILIAHWARRQAS